MKQARRPTMIYAVLLLSLLLAAVAYGSSSGAQRQGEGVSAGRHSAGEEGWLHYDEPSLGYSVSYPPDWALGESISLGYRYVKIVDPVAQAIPEGATHFMNGALIEISVESFQAPDLVPYMQTFAPVAAARPGSLAPGGAETRSSDAWDRPGVQLISENGEILQHNHGVVVDFDGEELLYQIRMTIYEESPAARAAYLATFQQILASLDFSPPASMPEPLPLRRDPPAPPLTPARPQAIPGIKLLTLPFFPHADMRVQQGWTSSFDSNHRGIDYIRGEFNDSDTWDSFDVLAAYDGEACGNCVGGAGNKVWITHQENGTTFYTYYGHLETFADGIPLGDVNTTVTVARGQLIGTAGETGAPVGWTHLHFTAKDSSDVHTDPYDQRTERAAYFPNTTYLAMGADHLFTSDPPSYFTPAGSSVSFGLVHGTFFANDTNSGAFSITPGTAAAFTQAFPVINFNPPAGTVNCSNSTGVGVRTRPFTDVFPQPDGSCQTIPAEGNEVSAGLDTLYNFQAVFTGTMTVYAPGQVTFNFFSDDGWVLSVGPGSSGAQPTHAGGALLNPPPVGPFTGYTVVGAYNTRTAPRGNDVVVNFPAAGRYPFELDYSECCGGELVLTLQAENGSIPQGSTISGTVFGEVEAPENVLPGSIVQACKGGDCHTTLTTADGHFEIAGLISGQYVLRAFGPTGSDYLESTVGPVTLDPQEELADQNIILDRPAPPPPGVDITHRDTGSSGIPIVFWGEPLLLTAEGCTGGAATYEIIQDGVVLRSGAMTEDPPGIFSATIPELRPNHGNAQVIVLIDCGQGPQRIAFTIYIDPSGQVMSTAGDPVAWATVTLLRSDSLSGTYTVVADQSNIMSVANRDNPDMSDVDGRYGWDVVAGYYKVRAEKLGCASAESPAQPFFESEALTIPPPVTDLILELDCPYGLPATIQATTISDTLPADGASITVITATVLDGAGLPVPLETVHFTTSLGALSTYTATTGLSGTVTTTLTVGEVPGTAQIGVALAERDLATALLVDVRPTHFASYLPMLGKFADLR